jgi:hypothetical protein
VLALTLLAFGLRCWGIDYGFPEPWAKPDERRWVGIALGILEDPNSALVPVAHAARLPAGRGLLGWGLFRVGRGDFPTYHAYMNEDMFVYPADLVLLGRVVSAATGALCVPLTWKLGERIGPRGSGLVGAALLALSFGPARDAHFALIEPLLLLGIVATLLLVVWALEKPTLARFVLAGIAAGLTTSAKYSGVSLVAPIALAVAFARRSEGRSLLGTAFDARGWAAAAATVAAFFAGSPYMLVSRREFWDSMAMREMSYKDTTFDPDIGFVHHVLFSLRWSHGLAMESWDWQGCLLLGWRSPARAIVTVYGLATYLGLGPARIIPMRYASSLAPCIVLGVAWALFELSRNSAPARAPRHARGRGAGVDPAYRLVRLGMLLSREDTRHAARLWLNAHYPEGVENPGAGFEAAALGPAVPRGPLPRDRVRTGAREQEGRSGRDAVGVGHRLQPVVAGDPGRATRLGHAGRAVRPVRPRGEAGVRPARRVLRAGGRLRGRAPARVPASRSTSCGRSPWRTRSR